MEEKSVENQEAQEPKETSGRQLFIAGLALACLLAGGVFFFRSKSGENREPAEISDQPAEEGRAVTRSEIEELFSEFRFREKFPVGDREYYLALSRDQLAMIQLLGSAESLEEITITTFMGPKNTDQIPVLAEYQKRMRKKITPGLAETEVSQMTSDGNKLRSDEFAVSYRHLELGEGHYSDSYSFKKIK